MKLCQTIPLKSRTKRAFSLAATTFLASAIASSVNSAELKEVGLSPMPIGAGPYYYDTAEQPGIRVDVVARGLRSGYSFTFLPNGDALIVERGTGLRLLRNATGPNPILVDTPIAGVPNFSSHDNIHPEDLPGIQDFALHPDFAHNHWVYYTYNRPVSYDDNVKRLNYIAVLARAKLNNMQLTDAEDLLVSEPEFAVGGSRIFFGKDDNVYISVGGLSFRDMEASQRKDNIYGKVLRIKADGSIPADNPFVNEEGARPEIYTFGHRDPLGLAFEPHSNSLIASEHGPQGGDEINRILPGRNYGWPTFTFGSKYGGSPLPTTPVGPDTEPPVMIWMPAIAPSGITFYTADKIPNWKDNLFVTSARRGEINGTGALIRVVFNNKLQELRQEYLLTDMRQRFKDVRQGPDGLLYALTDERDSVLLRISPTPEQSYHKTADN